MNNGDKLPQDDDAEKGLLGSMMLSNTVIDQVVERVSQSDFFHPRNQDIWRLMVQMRRDQRPIDLITVTDSAEKAGILKAIGDAAYVTDLFTFVPTASNWEHYAEIIREKAFARRVIAFGKQAIADANNPRERNLSEKVQTAYSSIGESSGANSLRDILSSRRFDAKNPPEPARTIYEINRQPICTPGNLTAISSHIKSGKSAFVGAAIASTFNRDGDTLGIDSTNPNEHAVIHFDCEQSPADHHTLVKIALSRVGIEEAPPWLRSYCLLGLPLAERWALLEYELKEAKRVYGAIHSILLDGYVDYVKDPNDADESFAAVERFHSLVVQYLTTMLGIIHLNPAGGNMNTKTRGHLGSQLARKAESNIELSKEDEITTVYTSSSRHAFISKQDGPRFKWDSEAKLHVSCGTQRVEKTAEGNDRLRFIAGEVFVAGAGLRYTEAIAEIRRIVKVKDARAEGLFTEMRKATIIKQDTLGFWRLKA